MNAYKKHFWLALGWVSLTLGIVGVVLPILPTTPFVLLAAYCFAKSSPKLHHWLIAHRRFGPLIQDWQSHGAISKTSKIVAIVTMIGVLALSLWLALPMVIIVVQALALGGAGTFILTRPSPPIGPTAQPAQYEER